uniref:Tyrosine-protein phosphatase domain-containing protein n=1 Tax=Rhabditophanes sp. KR3021 TaxID=114890 RepID=A0AC35TJW5_9BILA
MDIAKRKSPQNVNNNVKSANKSNTTPVKISATNTRFAGPNGNSSLFTTPDRPPPTLVPNAPKKPKKTRNTIAPNQTTLDSFFTRKTFPMAKQRLIFDENTCFEFTEKGLNYLKSRDNEAQIISETPTNSAVPIPTNNDVPITSQSTNTTVVDDATLMRQSPSNEILQSDERCYNKNLKRRLFQNDSDIAPKKSASQPFRIISSLEESNAKVTKGATFVFINFKTTGLIPSHIVSNISEMEEDLPEASFGSMLKSSMISVEHCFNEMPHITEISMRAVSRESYINAMNTFNDRNINKLVTSTDMTFQLNVPLDEYKLATYDAKVAQTKSMYLTSDMLRGKNFFHREWKMMKVYLENLKKPAVLVCHDGICFGFPVLLAEMLRDNAEDQKERNKMLNEFKAIEGLYFTDSTFTFKDLEANFVHEINLIKKKTNMKLDQKKEELFSSNFYTLAMKKRFNENWDDYLRNRKRLTESLDDLERGGSITNEDETFTLDSLNSTILGKHFTDLSHAAASTEVLMKVCLSYGQEFLKYSDNNCTSFNF